MKIFVYDQLFELMKIENERRLHLDSKANTYIGLLSIAITLFGALGGLLTIENIEFFRTLSFGSVLVIYILYLSIIITFLVAVLFAFKSYHTGSSFVNIQKDDANSAKSKEVYIKMNYKGLLDLLDVRSSATRDDLIEQLDSIIDINRKLNLKKSNNILISFYFTMGAIGLLIAMTIYLSALTLGILR